MSELKSYTIYEGDVGNYTEHVVYSKSEADEVIAELKSDITDLRDDKKLTDAILGERNSEIAELKAQKAQAEDDCAYWKMREGNAVNAMHETEEACMYLTKSERHQKYKRCLAMAKWCESENYTACWYHENSERCKWTEKWHNRWLKIAEKFKPSKEAK